jgi:hypothetical protein
MKIRFATALYASCTALAAFSALFTPALALADSTTPAGAQARYERERARCLSGQSQEDQKTCLREAGAALDSSRHHGLVTESADELAANARRRCDPLPPDDKKDCLARMNGEGTVTGSVAGGGILRELVTVIPGTPPEDAPPPAAGPAPVPAPTPTLPPKPAP